MGRSELVEAFSVERILKKSAVFDLEKLTWLNRQCVVHMPIELLVERAAGPLREAGVSPGVLEDRPGRVGAVLDLARERGNTVEVVAAQAAPFLLESITYDDDAVARFWNRPEEAASLLRATRDGLSEIASFAADALEDEIRQLASQQEVEAGKIIHSLRVAVMGTAVSPGIFAVLSLMGRERTLERIGQALGYLDAMAGSRLLDG
jgi:glutamyl/glutaminyl-tRNA synthetase